MNPVISLSIVDLALTASLLLLLALLNIKTSRKLSTDLIISMCRMFVQLSLIALVLKQLFLQVDLVWVLCVALVMALAAGREVIMRQKHRYVGVWGYLIGGSAMMFSSFVLCFFSLQAVIQADPWYHPQYAIPLLGMLLGNTLNGVSLCMDRLTESAVRERAMIETRLALGESWYQATQLQRQSALHSALIPTINSMAAAGLVSLPGMMTGQILAGVDPNTAVRYQMLIFLLIAVTSALSAYIVTFLGTRRLFDDRHRLKLDRLVS
jgi:putative ABC transport system permease protein